MPGSRCSKSVSLRTFSTPPRLPPVRGSLVGLANPPVLEGLPLATLDELLEPHAATASASSAARTVAATALVNLIGGLLFVLLLFRRPWTFIHLIGHFSG